MRRWAVKTGKGIDLDTIAGTRTKAIKKFTKFESADLAKQYFNGDNECCRDAVVVRISIKEI